jgi:hypothetical protein
MSATTTTPDPAFGEDRIESAERTGTDRRRALRWIAGGGAVAAALAALAIAVWPASETDKARADGEAYGAAVAALYAADTPSEVDAALTDMHEAAVDTRDHAGDRVASQIEDQTDAFERAADGYVGSRTADSDFDRDIYQTELDVALDDLSAQTSDFRAEGPEVRQAFWDGYQTGFNGSADATTTSSLD